jgi:hypothetical protein
MVGERITEVLERDFEQEAFEQCAPMHMVCGKE